MSTKLKANILKKTSKSICFEIQKDNFESFCSSIGLFNKEFIKCLDLSENDHKTGRVTKRKSLAELI